MGRCLFLLAHVSPTCQPAIPVGVCRKFLYPVELRCVMAFFLHGVALRGPFLIRVQCQVLEACQDERVFREPVDHSYRPERVFLFLRIPVCRLCSVYFTPVPFFGRLYQAVRDDVDVTLAYFAGNYRRLNVASNVTITSPLCI